MTYKNCSRTSEIYVERMKDISSLFCHKAVADFSCYCPTLLTKKTWSWLKLYAKRPKQNRFMLKLIYFLFHYRSAWSPSIRTLLKALTTKSDLCSKRSIRL